MILPDGLGITSLGLFFVVCAVTLFFMGRYRILEKDLSGGVVFGFGATIPLLSVLLLALLDIEPLFGILAATFSITVAVFVGLAMINLLTVGELRE